MWRSCVARVISRQILVKDCINDAWEMQFGIVGEIKAVLFGRNYR